jgi:hypothetical protein
MPDGPTVAVWRSLWEVERSRGDLAFLSKCQIEQLQYLDENCSLASECWEYLSKARQVLATLESSVAGWRGSKAQLRARARATATLVRLIERRLQSALRRMDLDDIGCDLAEDCDQDYKLLLLGRLTELPIVVE